MFFRNLTLFRFPTNLDFTEIDARVAEQAEPRFLLTVNLQIDYVAGAPLGCWLEGSAELLRSTRTLVFMRGLVTADGTPCARVSGISRIGPPFPKASDEFFDLVAR